MGFLWELETLESLFPEILRFFPEKSQTNNPGIFWYFSGLFLTMFVKVKGSSGISDYFNNTRDKWKLGTESAPFSFLFLKMFSQSSNSRTLPQGKQSKF